MTYEIEKNVPMPEYGPSGKYTKYPWYEMEIGDSFMFIGDKNLVQKAVVQWNRTHPETKFITRKQGDNECRVWRVK